MKGEYPVPATKESYGDLAPSTQLPSTQHPAPSTQLPSTQHRLFHKRRQPILPRLDLIGEFEIEEIIYIVGFGVD